EVNEVHTLVDEFAAAGNFRVRTPLAFVTQTATMPVSGADEHQRTEHAVVDELARLPNRRMVSVVETDTHETTGRSHRASHQRDLAHGPACGLLDQDMFAGFDGRLADCRESVVGGRHNHRVDVISADGRLP